MVANVISNEQDFLCRADVMHRLAARHMHEIESRWVAPTFLYFFVLSQFSEHGAETALLKVFV